MDTVGSTLDHNIIIVLGDTILLDLSIYLLYPHCLVPSSSHTRLDFVLTLVSFIVEFC